MGYLHCILTVVPPILASEPCSIRNTDIEEDMKLHCASTTGTSTSSSIAPSSQFMAQDMETEEDFATLIAQCGFASGAVEGIPAALWTPNSSAIDPSSQNIAQDMETEEDFTTVVAQCGLASADVQGTPPVLMNNDPPPCKLSPPQSISYADSNLPSCQWR